MTTAPKLEDVVLKEPIMGAMLNHRIKLKDKFCCRELEQLGANGDLAGDLAGLLFKGANAPGAGQMKEMAAAFIRRWPAFHLPIIREALLQGYRCPKGDGGGPGVPGGGGGGDVDPLPPFDIHFGAEIIPGSAPKVTITLEPGAIDIRFIGPGSLKGFPK